jgi:ribosomal protein S18 acetylase RimI-like enzyme
MDDSDAGGSTPLRIGEKDAELSERLSRELTAFNVEATGADDELGLFVRAADADGELVAGLTGWSWGGSAGISMLWVRADRRHESWGTRLVRAAEDEARRRGCTTMLVSSFTFQAPAFYQRLGYLEVGRSKGFPAGAEDVHHVKRLDGEQPAERLKLVVLVDVPEGHEAAVEGYEDKVLELLPRHGGKLERRLRTADSRLEVHYISFASRDGYLGFLADPDRAALRAEITEVELTNRVFEVDDVADPRGEA